MKKHYMYEDIPNYKDIEVEDLPHKFCFGDFLKFQEETGFYSDEFLSGIKTEEDIKHILRGVNYE